jgi:hypothetical protein
MRRRHTVREGRDQEAVVLPMHPIEGLLRASERFVSTFAAADRSLGWSIMAFAESAVYEKKVTNLDMRYLRGRAKRPSGRVGLAIGTAQRGGRS